MKHYTSIYNWNLIDVHDNKSTETLDSSEQQTSHAESKENKDHSSNTLEELSTTLKAGNELPLNDLKDALTKIGK